MRCGPFETLKDAKQSAERHNTKFVNNEMEVVVLEERGYFTMNKSMAEMFYPHQIVNTEIKTANKIKRTFKHGYYKCDCCNREYSYYRNYIAHFEKHNCSTTFVSIK